MPTELSKDEPFVGGWRGDEPAGIRIRLQYVLMSVPRLPSVPRRRRTRGRAVQLSPSVQQAKHAGSLRQGNVEPHEGSKVWGVLYAVSDDDMRRLDEGEAGYRRVRLSVRPEGNTDADAWVYVASRPSNDTALRPYTWYKRFLVEGAQEHSLPAEYVAELEHIDAIEDPNHQRDQEKRALACR